MAEITNIACRRLHPHPDNPRKELGDLTELAASIRENGIFQNLTVIPGHYMTAEEYADSVAADGGSRQSAMAVWNPKIMWSSDDYTIIIGHRRAAAAQQAGLFEVPCVVVEMDEREQLQTMMIENSIIANFLLPFVLLIGSYLFLGGTIASELLVAFMLMSLALSALLIAFEHSYNLLKELKLATSNLEQAFDTKPLSYKEEKVKLSHFDITFENVDFSYNQQTDVLHNISFHAPEGSTTALIGPSGSGKSTVANLIARFWDVTKGCVRIGGQDIRELNPDGLLHYISEVFQENTLLSDTIYNNIKAGREDATEQEVIAAAKAAHCHEFIERLPNGYQTHLAEGGNTLSGGEKQRIAIARAILKDAPILLLDESTASLDADNEAKINQALDRLMKGKTVFVIAHRLNTIQNADQIIVLNQGRIEETGTHEELLRKKGHYYEMVQEQQKAREWIVKGA